MKKHTGYLPKELFGDGDLEKGDADIKPENSRNVNLNIAYNPTFNSTHSIYIDAGFTYRHIKDYIIRIIGNKGVAESKNHGKLLSLGADFTARYFYKNIFSAGGNFTYQNIRNKERYDVNGAEAVIYNDRIPNVPYLFSNADAEYNIHNLLANGNTLTIGYNLQYVHEFYKSWQGDGTKRVIPKQFMKIETKVDRFLKY